MAWPVRDGPEESLNRLVTATTPANLLTSSSGFQLDEIVDAFVLFRVERREVAVTRLRDLDVPEPRMDDVFAEIAREDAFRSGRPEVTSAIVPNTTLAIVKARGPAPGSARRCGRRSRKYMA